MRTKWILLILWAACALTACGPAPTATPTAAATGGETEKTPVSIPGTLDKEKAVTVCVDTLAERLEVAEEKVEVVEAEAVQWPDTSLGCPEPGKMYAQVITPGFRVTLKVGNTTYEYHTDGKQAVTCPEP